jgi:predicted ATPase/predicted Ser/Thr protein kinase
VSSGRHDRISDLFLRACELDPEERKTFLDDACAGDSELRAEVESLLAHDGNRLFETGAGAARAVSILDSAEARSARDDASVDGSCCPDCGAPIPVGENDCPHCLTRIVAQAEQDPAIPGHRIVRLLGEGGMGRVYLAEDETLGRRVAIKLISETFAATDTAIQRFLREARTMATVEHPHIVRVYSFGKTEGRHYLVMEYVEGESLARRIRRPGKLGLDDALRVLRETTDALEAAWDQGIVHRDVKPANILLDARDRVRVADFGLAKTTELPSELSVTHVGQILGTPHYVSPEQARGERSLDFRSDVYALGIVLFEMLAGKPPFRGETPIAVVDQHLHTPLPSLRSHRPEIPGQVEQLCEWMTRKKPDDRPGSYADLRQWIDALLGKVSSGATTGPLAPFPLDEEEDVAHFFVGRPRELARLDELLGKAQEGEGQVVFVTGEAGSGKTALIAEFARRAQEAHEELIVARGNCDAQTGVGDPYLPFREVLGLLTGDVESRRTSGAITHGHARRLWSLLPIAAETLVESGPDLVGTFVQGEALVSRAEAFTPSPAGWRVRLEELVRRNATTPRDVTLQQSFLFDQYTRTILALAQHRPLLLQLEDLHWADGGSCNLLFHLGRRIAGHPVLVVGTYRPAEVALEREGRRHPLEPAINELRRAYGDLEVHVGEEESREFIDALVDHEPNRLTADFRDALYRQTRGHPLFAVELLRNMRDQEMLVRDEQDRWVEGPALAWGMLPARVEGAIGERIGRLPEELQKALSLASLQGEEFSAEVLAEVHGAGKREVVALLSRELDKRHHLVRAQGTRRIDGQRVSIYRFRHILFQKYLYGQMDDVERTYLHEEVGTALETLYGEQTDEVAVHLARHFREAGITDKAIRYLQQAGQRAVRLSANEEAVAHFRAALGLLEELTDSDRRMREELALQLALGPPLLSTVGPGTQDLYRAYTRARELCDQVGEAPQLFQALFILVHHHANRGELRTALELAEQMVGLAENAEEPLPAIMARWARGFVLHFLGRYGEARDELERVSELYDPQQHAALAYIFGLDPAVSALAMNGIGHWFLGYPERALASSERGVALAERVDHPATLGHALLHAALLAHRRGDIAAYAEHVERLVRLCADKGVVLFHAVGIFLRGALLVERGEVSEGLEGLSEGLAAMQATGSTLGHPWALCWSAAAHGKNGDATEGLTRMDEALAMARESDDRRDEPELHIVRGDLLLQRGASPDEAEACFRKSIELARGQCAKSMELRAVIRLSRLWQAAGRRDEAHELLAGIYGWFKEGLETADLKTAAALLDELS